MAKLMTSPYMGKVGKMIKIVRESKGITQEELALKCGYTSRSTINKIELGKCDVAFSKIMIISEALNIHPHTLFNSALSKKELEESFNNYLIEHYDKNAKKLLDIYSKLNDNGKEAAISILNNLTNNNN